jgi:signal transduction histidine kinase
MALASFILLNVLFQFRLRQKMQILKVRQKLHRDLHDDVGATLSAVKVYSEILQSDSQNPLLIELIKNNAVDMIEKLEVIAWATNPQHDTFKNFKEIISQHATSICYAKHIRLLIKSNDINETTVMPGDIRQNLFLIFKEALNNIIKHAEASQCEVFLSMNHQRLCFAISDNGKGFRLNGKVAGNGIKNMHKRAEEIKANLVMQSEPGNGTTLTVNLTDRF